MLTLFELFGVAFLFIWCGNSIPTSLFSITLLHMTTSTNCVQMRSHASFLELHSCT